LDDDVNGEEENGREEHIDEEAYSTLVLFMGARFEAPLETRIKFLSSMLACQSTAKSTITHTAPPSESFQCFDYTPQSNVDGEARRHGDVRSSVVYAVTF